MASSIGSNNMKEGRDRMGSRCKVTKRDKKGIPGDWNTPRGSFGIYGNNLATFPYSSEKE